ncbi:MAG: DUF1697 domain-containing protein [Bacteroidales bacterium]
MEQYIAFLRGINVSGQKIIKMEVLRKVFSEYGFEDVKTYIQSGNVLFKTDSIDETRLIKEMEDLIEKGFGFHTDVIVRKTNDLEFILNSSPLGKLSSNNNEKIYITFLKNRFHQTISVPLYSKNKDIEIVFENNLDLISFSHEVKGSYGFPNSFIEKLTGIPATTRNPNTLEKI